MFDASAREMEERREKRGRERASEREKGAKEKKRPFIFRLRGGDGRDENESRQHSVFSFAGLRASDSRSHHGGRGRVESFASARLRRREARVTFEGGEKEEKNGEKKTRPSLQKFDDDDDEEESELFFLFFLNSLFLLLLSFLLSQSQSSA